MLNFYLLEIFFYYFERLLWFAARHAISKNMILQKANILHNVHYAFKVQHSLQYVAFLEYNIVYICMIQRHPSL